MIKNRRSFTDSGGDGKTIVLLHGFLSSSRYWSKLEPLLINDGYRVITIDLLGFGDAPKPVIAAYDYSDHVNHVETTLRNLHIGSPFVIAGHSMGALVAARYSRMHPSAVCSTVLIHPPLYKDTQNARATLRRTGRLYRFLLDSPYRNLGWLIIKEFNFSVIGKHTHHSREKSLSNIIEAAEIFQDLESTAISTLLIIGSNDRKEYVDNLTERGINNVSVSVSIENISHHSPRTHPLLVKDLMVSFI